MAKEPDFMAIGKVLIGEDPMAVGYRPESKMLVVLNQAGQKFVFAQEKWIAAEKTLQAQQQTKPRNMTQSTQKTPQKPAGEARAKTKTNSKTEK